MDSSRSASAQIGAGRSGDSDGVRVPPVVGWMVVKSIQRITVQKPWFLMIPLVNTKKQWFQLWFQSGAGFRSSTVGQGGGVTWIIKDRGAHVRISLVCGHPTNKVHKAGTTCAHLAALRL